MLTALRWIRLGMIMGLPALGTAGLLLGRFGEPVDIVLRAVTVAATAVLPVIMFIGFTASVFTFPTGLRKALAVTLLTPALLLAATVAMGGGVWIFFVDECFAELGGMGVGAALAALAYGGGGALARIVGALVFGAAGAGAVYVFGLPMFEAGSGEPVWLGLNAVAIVWSSVTYFELFSAHAARRRPGEAAQQREHERAASLRLGPVVLTSIGAWLVALGVATAVALGR